MEIDSVRLAKAFKLASTFSANDPYEYQLPNTAFGVIVFNPVGYNFTERMVQGHGVLQPDGSMMVEPRMNADDVGRAVVYMASLPLDTNVPFMTVMANLMPFAGRG